MCGRFTLRTPIKSLVQLFDLGQVDLHGERPPRYNVAPTQEVAVVRPGAAPATRELAWLRWGLIPPWADDPSIGNQLINARAETVATKPAFRKAFATRRCLVPADGFFEWKRQHGSKRPYYIRLRDERPFAFAGLWQRWHRALAVIESCTIITTDANELVASLHNRMPAILDPQQFDAWLDPAIDDPKTLKPLLVPYPPERLVAYPVSTLVNSPQFDGPRCIEPAAPDKVQGSLFE